MRLLLITLLLFSNITFSQHHNETPKPDGSPIVFADLGSGIPSTDVNAVINAMEAMMNASQAI